MKKSFSGKEIAMAFPAFSVLAFAVGGITLALVLTLVLIALAGYLEARRARQNRGVQRRGQMNWAKYSVILLLSFAVLACSERTCPTYAGSVNKKVTHY